MTHKGNTILTISKKSEPINGTITLSGSKSISNRVLIIQALASQKFPIHHLSNSQDTQTLNKLLQSSESTLDAGHAGTTFRFLTAYLAFQDGTQILTGSDRMKQRPIGPLVDALRSLGANIEYLENEGYPPLSIGTKLDNTKSEISIKGNISSQFITAILLIAPTLENGITVNIEGKLVSRPYVEMTLSIMKDFGIKYSWTENSITVSPGPYIGDEYVVEGDWSSASYLFGLVALSEGSKLSVKGLFPRSLQGDSAIKEISSKLGVHSYFEDSDLILINDNDVTDHFEFDFTETPDLAQTVACICAAKNIKALFTGLETLYIKETDRVQALVNELQKFQVFFTKLPAKFTKSDQDHFLLDGNFTVNSEARIETYKDHRMALAFSILAFKQKLEIAEPAVVSKSYPAYWDDLKNLGFDFTVTEL